MKPSKLASPVLLPVIYFLLWLAAVPITHAAGNDEDEPIRINARSVEANEKTGVAVYRGNVVAERGRSLIPAPGGTVKLRQRPGGRTWPSSSFALHLDHHVARRKSHAVV